MARTCGQPSSSPACYTGLSPALSAQHHGTRYPKHISSVYTYMLVSAHNTGHPVLCHPSCTLTIICCPHSTMALATCTFATRAAKSSTHIPPVLPLLKCLESPVEPRMPQAAPHNALQWHSNPSSGCPNRAPPSQLGFEVSAIVCY